MSAIADVGAWSARISGKTVWTFVRVRDDGGRSGWGEATLQHRAAAIHGHVDRWSPAWVGRPSRPGTLADPPIADRYASAAHAAAWSAIDQARWDLAAQAENRTVAGMLGSPVRSTIPLYANINRGTVDRTADGFAARARVVAASGFGAIKIAPFDDVDPAALDTASGRRLVARGIERVHAVRAAIGPAPRLLVDCHWRFTEAAAIDVIRLLAPASLHWLECPLPEDASTLAALRRLRSQANERGMRLAGCESMTGLDAFRAFLDAGAYDVIMPDVKYAGGLAEMLKIGEAAERGRVECSPHNPTGPIAHLHSLHLSALLGSFPFLEFQLGESPRFFDLVDGDLPDPMRGTSGLPRGAGLGAGVDLARLAPLSFDTRAEAHGTAVR
jgi:galactonate dehydratase